MYSIEYYNDSINIYRTIYCYLYNVDVGFQLITLSQVKAVVVHRVYAFSDPMVCDVGARVHAHGPL